MNPWPEWIRRFLWCPMIQTDLGSLIGTRITPKECTLKQLERRSLKKSGLQRDLNPWPRRYQCDALPTELWSHTLGARSIYWVHIFPCSEIRWSIYENNNSYLYCGCRWKWRMIIAVNSNLSNWKEESRKNQGFNRIRTCDLSDTGAMLYQLSYEATHWEWGQFIEFISSHAVK